MRENGSVNMFFTAQKKGMIQFQMGAIGHRFLMPLAVSQPANEHMVCPTGTSILPEGHH